MEKEEAREEESLRNEKGGERRAAGCGGSSDRLGEETVKAAVSSPHDASELCSCHLVLNWYSLYEIGKKWTFRCKR